MCYVAMAIAAVVILVSLIGFCGTLNNDKRIFFVVSIMNFVQVMQ